MSERIKDIESRFEKLNPELWREYKSLAENRETLKKWMEYLGIISLIILGLVALFH